MYNLWVGYTNFPLTLRPFQKPWIHNSDIYELKILNRVIAWVLMHTIFENPSSMCASLPRAASDFHSWGKLKYKVHTGFEASTHSNPILKPLHIQIQHC